MDYCSASDLYDHGLPRGSIPNRGRRVVAANASLDVIVLGEHGFALNQEFTCRVDAGVSNTLPAPLVAEVSYYAIPVNGGTFKAAATVDGAAVDLTTNGNNFVVVTPINYAASIAFASRLIDEMLVGNVLIDEGDEIPEIVRMTCAEIAVGKLALIAGFQSKSLGEIVDQARQRLAAWAKGKPLRAKNAPAAAQVATSAAATVPFRDSRNWSNGGNI